jgi:3-methylfumaryl-CoA hydratase
MAAEHDREEQATLGPILKLSELLDHETPPQDGCSVPPLGHWLYFHPQARQGELRADGHPRHIALLPADLPPRRMWAGGRIRFLSPIQVGDQIRRRTALQSITSKAGRSGPLVFVALQHILSVGRSAALIEDQDIVYREAEAVAGASMPRNSSESEFRIADSIREVLLDITALFRYSALTYNAHRIHYDRDYAMTVEGYSGLVVQGPFLATLLIDHFRRQNPHIAITEFSFRARRPVFAERPLLLCLRRHENGALLWVEADGAIAFTASVNSDPEAAA